MTAPANHTVAHGVFTIERSHPGVTTQRVFDAFATAQGKQSWFNAPPQQWTLLEREFDFRVGGRERLKGKWTSGEVSFFDATYFDIVPAVRIVYAYDMWHDGRKLSVSLATIEFKPAAGGGTDLRVTEQGAFLDGYDDAGSREKGTRDLIDLLSAYLEG